MITKVKLISVSLCAVTILSAVTVGCYGTLTHKKCHQVDGLHANLIRFITKEGFHREIEDTVEITVTNSKIPFETLVSGCLFALYTDFDENLFVDPYEIAKIKDPMSRIRVLNPWTDLENPSWMATSNTTVFVQLEAFPTGNLLSMGEVHLPIHFRYQKPTNHSLTRSRIGKNWASRHLGSLNAGGYVPVNVFLPKLLLRCRDWDELSIEEECEMVHTICHSRSSINEKCTWISVPFKSNSRGNTVFIPTGDLDHRNVVSFGTFFIICGGCLFLLFSFFRAAKVLKAQEKLHRD